MKECLIIHHTDNDGYGAAGVVSYFMKDNYSVTFVPVNYTEPLFRTKDIAAIANQYIKVYLVDYSISTKENAESVLLLNDLTHVVWIDHHKSSIDMIKEYPELAIIGGYRVIGLSGAALSWIYMQRSIAKELKFDESVLSLDNISNTYEEVNAREAIKILDNCGCPEIIKYIHRYDIWDLDNNVKLFKYGYTLEKPQKIYPCIYHVGIDKDTVKEAINRGKIILDYVTRENRRNCESNSFEISVEYKGKTYSCLALNTNRFSSLTFGDKMKYYDICIPFEYNGKSWSISMYTEKDDIDVSELCKTMGGGGHAKAAGFVSDELCIQNKKLVIE